MLECASRASSRAADTRGCPARGIRRAVHRPVRRRTLVRVRQSCQALREVDSMSLSVHPFLPPPRGDEYAVFVLFAALLCMSGWRAHQISDWRSSMLLLLARAARWVRELYEPACSGVTVIPFVSP